MSRDIVERLAFTVARQLRAALGHPATANEHASGYGTVCMTGHPVFQSLWLQCVVTRPEQALIMAERHAAAMTHLVLHRGTAATINVTTRLWMLDELRWLAQHETSDAPRTPLDTLLSRLNHGNMAVVIHLTDLIHLTKRVIEMTRHERNGDEP
jgi:hypothetical protein